MIEVDDRIPVGDYDEPLILTSGNLGELWPTILAKAVYQLWDRVGGRGKAGGDFDGGEELAETANFSAFAFYVLTGWLPQGVAESVNVEKLTGMGVSFGEVSDFMVHVPNPADDLTGYQRDSPKKKLGKILSPKKKSKKRKNKKPPPPHPISIENTLRTDHNRIVEIRKSLENFKSGESVLIFHDSLQNVVIFPILALAANPVATTGQMPPSSRPGSPQTSAVLGVTTSGSRPSSPLNVQTSQIESIQEAQDEGPLLLLSWDCDEPMHSPYNDKGVIPNLPSHPTPQMTWMSITDLAYADCRVLHMNTLSKLDHSALSDITLPDAAKTWVAPPKEGEEVPPAADDEAPPVNEVVAHKGVVNFEPSLVSVDLKSIQPVRYTPAGPPRLVIAGPPAGGKGTQCEYIKEKYGVVHLSTGDMLRAAVAAETEVGLQAKACMEAGELVGDDIITNIVIERLKEDDCKEKGWLLDGFPRTEAQAESLMAATADAESGILPPDAFVVLDVPSEILVERVVGRRSDPETGKIYHMTFSPPETEEIAARLVQRADDTEEAIVVRIDTFQKNMEGILAKFDDKVIFKVDGGGDKTEIGKIVLAGIENLINPPKKLANLVFTVTVNNNQFALPEPEVVEEKKEEEEEKEKGEEKKEPEETGNEGAGEGEEGIVEESVTSVEKFDPYTTLPAYCGKSVLSLVDYYNPKVKYSVTMDSRSSLNIESLSIALDPEECSGVFRLEHKAVFGASVQLTCDAPVAMGPASEVFPASGSDRQVIVETGSGRSMWAGETVVLFRKVIKPETSGTGDFELVVENPAVASCVNVHLVQGGGIKRLPGKRFKVTVEAGEEAVLVGVVGSRKMDLPAFDWKLICLSEVSLVSKPVLAEGEEPPEEEVKALGAQGCGVVTTYGGVYVPNKYFRLFKDVITVGRDGPISLKFGCGGGAMVKLTVKDEESGSLLWEGKGKSGLFAISINLPEAVKVEKAEGEEGGGEEEEAAAAKYCKLSVEGVIDCGAMDATPYESIKPYYFTPAVIAAPEEGEEVPQVPVPVVPNQDGGLEWTLAVTSPKDIVVSNHMATLDFEEAVRKTWEGEVGEGEVARSDRADVLWQQLDKGGELVKPEYDEDGNVISGEDAGGKGKKGKGKKGADAAAEDETPKMPMPGKGEDGNWNEEQLFTVISRSAATLVDIKLEDGRCEIRKSLNIEGEVATGGDGEVVLLSEAELDDIAKSDQDSYEANVGLVAATKGRLEEERERCTADLDEQLKIQGDLKVQADEVYKSQYDAREEYRKRKIAEKLDAEDRAEKERLRLEEEARLAEEARIAAEKESKKKKK